jgi:hypothetical protein
MCPQVADPEELRDAIATESEELVQDGRVHRRIYLEQEIFELEMKFRSVPSIADGKR